MDIPFKKTKCESYKHYQCAKLFGVQTLSIELLYPTLHPKMFSCMKSRCDNRSCDEMPCDDMPCEKWSCLV